MGSSAQIGSGVCRCGSPVPSLRSCGWFQRLIQPASSTKLRELPRWVTIVEVASSAVVLLRWSLLRALAMIHDFPGLTCPWLRTGTCRWWMNGLSSLTMERTRTPTMMTSLEKGWLPVFLAVFSSRSDLQGGVWFVFHWAITPCRYMWSNDQQFQKVGWHATWHGHLRKEDTPLNKWLKAQGASWKNRAHQQLKSWPVKPRVMSPKWF